jgi:hypothetical protein
LIEVRAIIVIFSLFFAIGIGVVGYAFLRPEHESRRKNANLIEQSYKERLLPASTWVKSFVVREHRLPQDHELGDFCIRQLSGHRIEIYREPPTWQRSWGVQGTDFMLVDAIPEWNLYYCSWNGRRIEAWTD